MNICYNTPGGSNKHQSKDPPEQARLNWREEVEASTFNNKHKKKTMAGLQNNFLAAEHLRVATVPRSSHCKSKSFQLLPNTQQRFTHSQRSSLTTLAMLHTTLSRKKRSTKKTNLSQRHHPPTAHPSPPKKITSRK